MRSPQNTRRWPRHPVELPVSIVLERGSSTTVVTGRATEISEGGMLLYAGILLEPGDMLKVEFNTASHSTMRAIVRYREGYCFGLEFIAPLPS
jgi:PilZ domain